MNRIVNRSAHRVLGAVMMASFALAAAAGSLFAQTNEAVSEPLEFDGHQGAVVGLRGRVRYLAFSPDGKRITVAQLESRNVHVWDVDRGKETLPLAAKSDSPFQNKSSDYVYAVAYRPDGKQLTAASSDGFVRVWNLTPR